MKQLKQMTGVLLGTMCVGLGVALFKLSQFGQDSLSAMVFSLMYWFDIEGIDYSVYYIGVNVLFLVGMVFFLRNKIHIGTIINVLLTGVCASLFLQLFEWLNWQNGNWPIRLLESLFGLVIISFGIALYGSANLGIAPYDGLPMICNRLCPKLSYAMSRIMVDLCCTIIAFVIGVCILHKTDIIHINTIFTFIAMGPLIAFFSKKINQYIYKWDQEVFS